MSTPSKSLQMLSHVSNRMHVIAFARSLFTGSIGGGVLYLVALLTSRFSGIIPDWFTPWTLTTIPAAGLLWAVIFHRRPTVADAARRVDHHAQTKDLYLTVSRLEQSAGEYQPLVLNSAEERASSIRPAAVIPFGWERETGTVAMVVAVLLLAVLFIPQLDPFGKVQAAQQQELTRTEIEQSRKATAARAEQIKKENEDGGESEEVRKAISELTSTFRKMEPNKKQQNLKVLTGQQKEIGGKWKQISNEQLQKMLSAENSDQKFGGNGQSDKMQKWMDEMKAGSTDSLEKQLVAIEKDLKELMEATDPKEKAKLQRELKQKLQELEKFASDKANARELTAAVERTMKQLELAKSGASKQDQKEAMQAMAESMKLVKMEMKTLSESVQEMQQLEEALKTIQMAKQANDMEALDGSQCESCNSLADYAELYAQIMDEMGMDGDSMSDKEGEFREGSRGVGRGGIAGEDDEVATDFKKEQSKSPVTAGKMLLSIKTKGMSDSGESNAEYQRNVALVKQGVSEAIDQEQIPPGYVDGIKRYFDNLDRSTQGNDTE